MTKAKFEAGKTYFTTWNEDTGRPHTKRYTIEKRTAKTIVIHGYRSKIFTTEDGIEGAKVSYATYIYADKVYGEEAIKAQVENDKAWDKMDADICRRAEELKAAEADREEILSTPLVSVEAQDEAVKGEYANCARASMLAFAAMAPAFNTELKKVIDAEPKRHNEQTNSNPVTKSELEMADNAKANETPEIKSKKKSAMTVEIEREEEQMTITVAPVVTKGRVNKYFIDGFDRDGEDSKYTKVTAEIVIQSYILRDAIGCGATIFIDERLASEFKAIAETPYKGEFKLVYMDKDGRPVKVGTEAQDMFAEKVDMTPYHIEIKMFGENIPMFEILKNGQHVISKNGSYRFRKGEVDAWIIRAYQMRKQYPNMTIEIPRVVAGWLDSLCCNSRRIFSELNITLTEETNEADPAEYAISEEAMEVATNAEIELAENAKAVEQYEYMRDWVAKYAKAANISEREAEIFYVSFCANSHSRKSISAMFETQVATPTDKPVSENAEVEDTENKIESATNKIHEELSKLEVDPNADNYLQARYLAHATFALIEQKGELPWHGIAIRSTDFARAERALNIIREGLSGLPIDFIDEPQIEFMRLHDWEENVRVYHVDETDGSEDDTADEETFTAIIPADADDADDELIDPPAEVIVAEIKIGDDIVEYHDGKFFGVQSMKYGGLIHLLPNGDLAYKTNPLTLDGKRIDFEDIDRWDKEDYFQIMAERGAFVIGEPTFEKPADDFMSKLAELKAEADAANAGDRKARDAEVKAYNAWQAAKQKVEETADKYRAAIVAYKTFGCQKAKELRDTLLENDIKLFSDAKIKIINQKGEEVARPDLSQIFITFYDSKFRVTASWDWFAEYDTPAEVTDVIERLKAAIRRGDTEFSFAPEAKPINQPDNSTPDKLRDSLARGMKECLLKVQSYCAENNLTEAKVEMERYQICSQALHESCAGGASDNPSELLDDELKQSREFKYYLKQRRPVKGSAPEGYISAKDGVMKVTVNSPHVKRPINKTYYGEYIYDKPLTDRQIIDYDLAVENEIGIDEEARIQRVIKEKEPRPITA